MFLTVSGIETDSRFQQPRNAQPPIEVTPSGILMLLILVLLNEEPPITFTGNPFILLGITTVVSFPL